jgi:aspartate-semialdehyde dehydrogenase
MADPQRGRVVAVVGATGAVGEVLLEVLEERRFPVGELRPLASERSAGTRVRLP